MKKYLSVILLINLFSYIHSSEINKQIINQKRDDFHTNNLKGYRFYEGSINLKNSDGKIVEENRNINYKNSDNLFNHPENKNDIVHFFIESVILGIPKDINALSENRNNLDKSILFSIAKLKTEENPINFFKYKEVYSLRGKSVYQLEFNFNLDGRVNVYFIALNNRTGNWRIETISVKKPFLTSR